MDVKILSTSSVNTPASDGLAAARIAARTRRRARHPSASSAHSTARGTRLHAGGCPAAGVRALAVWRPVPWPGHTRRRNHRLTDDAGRPAAYRSRRGFPGRPGKNVAPAPEPAWRKPRPDRRGRPAPQMRTCPGRVRRTMSSVSRAARSSSTGIRLLLPSPVVIPRRACRSSGEDRRRTGRPRWRCRHRRSPTRARGSPCG